MHFEQKVRSTARSRSQAMTCSADNEPSSRSPARRIVISVDRQQPCLDQRIAVATAEVRGPFRDATPRALLSSVAASPLAVAGERALGGPMMMLAGHCLRSRLSQKKTVFECFLLHVGTMVRYWPCNKRQLLTGKQIFCKK